MLFPVQHILLNNIFIYLVENSFWINCVFVSYSMYIVNNNNNVYSNLHFLHLIPLNILISRTNEKYYRLDPEALSFYFLKWYYKKQFGKTFLS